MRFKQTRYFCSRSRADNGLNVELTPDMPGKFSCVRWCNASTLTVVLAGVCLSAAVTAMALIAHYSNSPGHAETTPLEWPAPSRIPLDATRPTLIMFAHP